MARNETVARRFRGDRVDRLIKDDIRDLEPLRHIQTLNLFVDLLRQRVGSPVVLSNLAEDLQVSPLTLKHWLEILEKMYALLPEPRPELSPYAPRVISFMIDKEKIGAVIGPGGKNIKRIQADTGATIEIEEDGTVMIYAADAEATEKAKKMVEECTATAVIGKVYQGTVTGIKDFGAFVEIMPGTEGLVHISELSDGFVGQVTDVVKMGDPLEVKVISIDDMGKVKLSRKALLVPEGTYVPSTPGGGGRGRPFGRDDRDRRPRR